MVTHPCRARPTSVYRSRRCVKEITYPSLPQVIMEKAVASRMEPDYV
jgi:hypothetical protein